ncbi:hypothetical protein FB107DRAFT_293002 [Schizophyllum commune]
MSLDTITIPQLAFTGFAVFATASFCTSATIEGFFFTFFIASLLFPGVYFMAKAEREHAIASTPPSQGDSDTEDDYTTDRVANDDPRDDIVGDVPHQRDIEQPRHGRAPSQRVRFVEHFGASDPREEHNSSTQLAARDQELAARDHDIAARDEEIAARDREIRGRNAPVIPPPPQALDDAYGRPQRFSGMINQASGDCLSTLELGAPYATENQGTAGAQMSTKAAPEGQPQRVAHLTREDGAPSASWGRFSHISVPPSAGTNEPNIPTFAGQTQRSETHSQYGHISTRASAQCAFAGPVSALTGRAPQQGGRPGWFDASASKQSERLEIQRDANVSDDARGRSQERPAQRCFREALKNARPRERHGYQAQGLARAQPVVVGPSVLTNATTSPAPTSTAAAPSGASPYPPRPPRAPQQMQRPMAMNGFIDSRVHIPSLRSVDTTSVVPNDSPVPPPYLSRLPPSPVIVAPPPPPAAVAPRAPASMSAPAGRGLARDDVHDSSSCVANGAACELPPGFVPTSFVPFSDAVNDARNDTAAHGGTERDGSSMGSRIGTSVAGPIEGIIPHAPARGGYEAQSHSVSSGAPASTTNQLEQSVARWTFGRVDAARGTSALQSPSAYRSGGGFPPFWLTVEWAQNRTISVRFDSFIGRQEQSSLYIHDEAALDGAASTLSELLGSAWDPYPGEEDKRPAMLVRANIQSLAPVDAFLRILVARSLDTPANLDTLAFPSTTIIYSGAPENVPYPWSSIIGLSNYQVRKLDIRCTITQEECMAIAGSDAEYMNGRVLRWVPLQLRLVRVISDRDAAGRRATFFSRLQSLHVLQLNPILARFRDRLLEEGKRCMQIHVEFLID